MKIVTKRRAISSIIGSVVFLVLMVSGFTTLLYAMDVTSDRFSEQLSSSFEETLRAKEKFSFIPSVDNDNLLYVQVDNEGTNSLNVVDVWVSNQGTGAYTLYDVDFKDAHIASNEKKNVLKNIDPTSKKIPDGTYNIKVVTELGTSMVKELIAPLNPLSVKVLVAPQNLGSGYRATVTMFVYNIGDATVNNITPFNPTSNMVNPSNAIEDSTGPTPTTISTLEPNETVVFSWDVKLIGAVGTSVVFTNSVVGTDSVSNSPVTSNTDSATLEFVPTSITLVQRPDIALLIPSPSGESGGSTIATARWGVSVSNPTSVPISVSRVIITALANSPDVAIFKKTSCSITSIPLTFDGTWSCPADNVLMWQSISSPIPIPARSSQSFLVEVPTGSISSGANDPATTIQATVYTAFGPTSRTGVVSGLTSGNDGVVANIYASNSNTPLTNDSIIGNISNIISNTAFNLDVTLADFSTGNNGIAAGTRINIIIPPGFTVGTITYDSSIFTNTLDTPIKYPDGSHQITGLVESPGIGIGGTGYGIVRIALTAPTVTSSALYTVFAMAEGTTTNSDPVSPIVEIPLQVVPLP